MRSPPCIALALVLAGVLLAGCLDGDEGLSPTSDMPATGPLVGALSGLPVEPRTSVSLSEPPAWRLGEWWRIEFDAPPYGLEVTVERVIVGVDGEHYLVGMAREGFDDGVMLLHFPGFGEVRRADLAFDAHDRLIELLRFPLADGATWETQWYSGAAMTATVTEVTETTATIHLTGARSITILYDATIGEIRRFQIEGYGGYEVVEHGYGYEGDVRVPAGQDLVFCHGRAAVVIPIDLCVLQDAAAARGPQESVPLAEGYDRVSFGLFVADMASAPVAPGVLHIEVTAPSGDRYAATKGPRSPGMALYPHALDDPAGTWDITAVAGGAGLAILEGVAYRVIDVTME